MNLETDKVTDRPYPFELKTAIMRLCAIAMTTSSDVADISVQVGLWNSVEVRMYVGGYDSKNNSAPQIAETLYLTHESAAIVIKNINELIAKIDTLCANGRKIKADRMREEAAALLKKADEIEQRQITEAAA